MWWYYVLNVVTLGFPWVIKVAVRKGIIEANERMALTRVTAYAQDNAALLRTATPAS